MEQKNEPWRSLFWYFNHSADIFFMSQHIFFISWVTIGTLLRTLGFKGLLCGLRKSISRVFRRLIGAHRCLASWTILGMK